MRHSYPFLLFLLFLLPACDTTDVDAVSSNLDAPVQDAPFAASVVQAGEGVLFQWIPVEDAQAYRVEIVRQGQPASRLVLQASGAGLTHVFEESGTYTWRVCASDARGRGGYWSARRRFVVSG
jgi:hypothetical protein